MNRKNTSVLSQLKIGSHVHLMGICGTAMGSLAGLLKEKGYKVTGSDQNVYPPMSTQLQELGIEIYQGYKKENLNPKPDLVIVGNVISAHFEEAQELLNSDIPYTSLPAALGEWAIGNRNSLVVTGTHGKTTTTSMLSWIAETCDKNPGFLIGGIPLNFPRSFRNPPSNNDNSEYFVIEGDEYDTAFFDKVPKFVHYRPKYVILTSIEFDHADIYSDINEILSAFKKLLELIPEDGLLVYNAEDKNIPKILEACRARKVSYGLQSGDYKISDRQNLVGRNQMSVEYKGQNIADLAIKQFGPHNTMNALASFVIAKELGWSGFKVMQGLATFNGVKRRQEILLQNESITIVEDFAHHPTAVSLTLDCMKEQFPGKRVIAIYEPRSATSRRNVFEKEYIAALQKADVIFLPQAFDQAKITEESRFSSERVIQNLQQLGKNAYYCKDVEEIVKQLHLTVNKGDIVLIMSNGGFGGIYQKILNLIIKKFSL
ncbi:MAG: UDP-N-acetylmuramate:L-alanyl-gamma-D-glutamyl-meso-diaminopimelate ligase [Bdellovibrionales bacterium]|nr:UDP-N-acetylmuramate:L-alanyl-gamma-D-glutamyl-meso-diaminopimelate ligase [Bdellovibrionales bacterium]